MISSVSFVFPHQLFKNNPCLEKHRRVFIIEDDLFFKQLPFHKQKLTMHHASMQYYKDYLTNNGYKTTYIDAVSYAGLEALFKRVLDSEVREIHMCDPVDYLLKRRLSRYAQRFHMKLVFYQTPNFLNSTERNQELFGDNDSYFMADFYKKQRLHLQLLLDGKKPLGGKWSLDAENRKALPKNAIVPLPWFPKTNQYVIRAKEYVKENFSENPGEIDQFVYPVTFEDAEQLLEHYFQDRFYAFGVYQDAFSDEHPFLFHSILSAPLNCGLLTPEQLIERAIFAFEHESAPLNSVEGFIRQVIGWREFVRAVYEREGVKQRTTNHWNYQQPLTKKQLKIGPLAKVHRKLEQFAYAHHIERLMVLGNFFVLSKIHPDEAYRYFMTYFIDAYDWVMVPNVYGMSLHADGGIMTTKPYVSSSNYLKKQGAKLTANDAALWDALYWNFISENRSFFDANHRTKPMIFQLNRMTSERLKEHLSFAGQFLKQD